MFGANITLTEFWKTLEDAIEQHPRHKTESFHALLENLRWFAGKQIRNVATLAGNICTASPISDLNPVLVASRATALVSSASRGEREISLNEFFLGYRKTALAPDEVMLLVTVPFTQKNEYVRAYKQAKRKDDDIAIANAGIRVKVNDQLVIEDAMLAFGGMGPTTVQAKKAAKDLVGIKLDDAEAIKKLSISIIQEVFRLLLCGGG